MKLTFAACLVACATTAFAQSGRDIYDVMYLPKAETTYGFSTVSYQMSKIEDSVDSKTKGYKLEQTLGYSFTDSFSVQVAMNYVRLINDADGATRETKQSGFSDGTVTARYRLMDSTYRLDLVGGALLSLGDREIKSDGNSTNVIGGNNYFGGVQFGQKHSTYQWSILGQYAYQDVTYTDTATEQNERGNAFNSFLVRADLLNKIMEKSFIRTHLLADISEKSIDADFSNDKSTKTYEVGAEFQHLCTPNLLARAGVDYQMKDTDADGFDSYNLVKFTVGANYQF